MPQINLPDEFVSPSGTFAAKNHCSGGSRQSEGGRENIPSGGVQKIIQSDGGNIQNSWVKINCGGGNTGGGGGRDLCQTPRGNSGSGGGREASQSARGNSGSGGGGVRSLSDRDVRRNKGASKQGSAARVHRNVSFSRSPSRSRSRSMSRSRSDSRSIFSQSRFHYFSYSFLVLSYFF
jgi:hypothetical protein